MATARIFRINYKSDFILTLHSDAGWMTPFCIKFWTGAPSQAYYASFDGTDYTNCAAGEDPKVLTVQFDDHGLPIGDLKFQVAYHFTVADFPNDTEDEVINQANITTEIDGQTYQVMLDFNGETAPEIEFSLPAYANEAQRIENEQTRIANEESRVANEEQRVENEQARVEEYADLKADAVAATAAANDAAALANQKAQLAQQKAGLADDAATLATQKAGLADDAATLATQKAGLANDAAALATQKAGLAGDAATLATQKAGLANDAAALANQKAQYASDQGDYAKAQGDYAKAQADVIPVDVTRSQTDATFVNGDHNPLFYLRQANSSLAGLLTAAGYTKLNDMPSAQEVNAGLAYDVSVLHPTSGVSGGSTYASLSAALAVIPQNKRKGGMTVKFVLSSDNKYLQYMYKLEYVNTTAGNNKFVNVANWEKVSLEKEVKELYALDGISSIANGSNGNSGNTYLVHTEVIATQGARCAVIKVNKPNVTGYHYAFGWALTSSKADIGTIATTNLWDGFINKMDVTATSTDFILDMSIYPNAVGVSFTIGEFDGQGTYRTLRASDFEEGDVIINCQPGMDNLITDKIHQEIAGLDITSFAGNRGYYNASGTFVNDNSYRHRYIDVSYFYRTQLIVGQCNFVHFFDIDKQWLSCFSSAQASYISQISKSDIPANCAFVVVCCRTANTYLKLINNDEYLATQRLTPFYPLLRNGTPRYPSTKNYLSTAILFPAYGASSVRFIILKSAETGLHYEIQTNLYTSVSQLTTDSVIPNLSGEWEATNIAEVNMAEYEGVAFAIRKMDGSGNLQTLDYTEFSEGETLMERIYVPELLLPVFNNNAFARNRDKEAMMAAAVRANKKAEGSMDFMSLILTDSHGDALSESNAVVMADNFQYIQALLHLGDFCGSDATISATNFNSARYNKLLGCKKPFYFVAGNHDVGNSVNVANCITNAQYYTRFVQPMVDAGLLEEGEYSSGKGYYYHDFTSQKIRLICIYEYDDPNDLDPNDSTKYRYRRGDSVISQAQAEWFCATLTSTPADYGVIVAMHNPFSSLADCVTTAKFNHPNWVDGYGAQRLFSTDIWADIVDAWVNKSSNYTCTMVCTGNASYLNTDGKYYEFSYDFSGRNNTAKFICFIGGHVHEDCVWRHRNYQYQYQVTPICSNSTKQQSAPSDIRRINTDGLAKDSLTAIGYDYDNQAIRLVKLGVNVTEDMRARDYELIETQEI